MVIDRAALINEHFSRLLILIHSLFILFNNWSFNLTNKIPRKEQNTYKGKYYYNTFNSEITIKMNENSSSLDLNTLWVEYKNADGRVSYFNLSLI